MLMKNFMVVALIAVVVFLSYRHFRGSEDPGDRPIVYSLSYCGYCKKLSSEMTAAGIDFVEYYVDKDKKRSDELQEKLAAQNMGGGILMPVVDLGDVFLPNRPTIAEVESYFE